MGVSEDVPIQTAHTLRGRQVHCSKRQAKLAATGLMDSPPEDIFDRAVRLATKVTGRPVGLLSLVDGSRQFFKAQQGLTGWAAEDRQTPLSHSFCQHVVDQDAPLRVTDAREDPLLRDNLAIPDLDVIAYLGVPVRGPDGSPLGSFCVIDDAPYEWNDEELAALEDITAMIEAEISLREAAKQRDMVLDEMNHRMKNVFTLVSGMIRQTERASADKKAMSEALSGRLQALSMAHSLVIPSASRPEKDVTLNELAESVLAPHPKAQIATDGPDITLGPKAAVAFALILHELATNAAKYGAFCDGSGQIDMTWGIAEDQLSLSWREVLAREIAGQENTAGFGSRLLQMNVESQLNGVLKRDLTPRGMHVSMAVPIDALGS